MTSLAVREGRQKAALVPDAVVCRQWHQQGRIGICVSSILRQIGSLKARAEALKAQAGALMVSVRAFTCHQRRKNNSSSGISPLQQALVDSLLLQVPLDPHCFHVPCQGLPGLEHRGLEAELQGL